MRHNTCKSSPRGRFSGTPYTGSTRRQEEPAREAFFRDSTRRPFSSKNKMPSAQNICLPQIVPHFQVLIPYVWIDRTFRSQLGENRIPESWRLRKFLRHGVGLAALKCHLDVPSQPLRLHTAGIDQ